jgi:hypothetical protein
VTRDGETNSLPGNNIAVRLKTRFHFRNNMYPVFAADFFKTPSRHFKVINRKMFATSPFAGNTFFLQTTTPLRFRCLFALENTPDIYILCQVCYWKTALIAFIPFNHRIDLLPLTLVRNLSLT